VGHGCWWQAAAHGWAQGPPQTSQEPLLHTR
jgi:hypothetical protein